MITKKQFVISWQQSASLSEVIFSTGLALVTVKKYAYRMRKNGVKLKPLEGENKRTSWAELADLAESTIADQERHD